MSRINESSYDYIDNDPYYDDGFNETKETTYIVRSEPTYSSNFFYNRDSYNDYYHDPFYDPIYTDPYYRPQTRQRTIIYPSNQQSIIIEETNPYYESNYNYRYEPNCDDPNVDCKYPNKFTWIFLPLVINTFLVFYILKNVFKIPTSGYKTSNFDKTTCRWQYNYTRTRRRRICTNKKGTEQISNFNTYIFFWIFIVPTFTVLLYKYKFYELNKHLY